MVGFGVFLLDFSMRTPHIHKRRARPHILGGRTIGLHARLAGGIEEEFTLIYELAF